MEKIFMEIIERHLLKEEKILWTGKSDIRKLFTKSDILLIPTSIIFGMFGLYLMIAQAGFKSDVNVISSMFDLPFVAIVLYLMVGRFIVKKYNKKNILYVITDKQILIIKVGIIEKVIKKYINQITSIDISTSKDGIGTITFGETTLVNKFCGNTGLKVSWAFYVGDVPTFYDIHDAKEVHELVNNLRNQG